MSEATGGLRATGVGVQFSGLRAVDDVHLEIDRGQILGLIGPNGAGKTTLVNALTGFQRCDGTLYVDGLDVTNWSPRRRARLGVRRTFQNVRLFMDMTVLENVEVTALGLGLSLNPPTGLWDRRFGSGWPPGWCVWAGRWVSGRVEPGLGCCGGLVAFGVGLRCAGRCAPLR